MTAKNDLRTHISEQLKQARINAGLTVTEAAEALGKSKNTIYSWELGRILPTADVLLQVMVMYGIKDFNVFLRGGKGDEAIIPLESENTATRAELTAEQAEILDLLENADERGKTAARAVLETYSKKGSTNVVHINRNIGGNL